MMKIRLKTTFQVVPYTQHSQSEMANQCCSGCHITQQRGRKVDSCHLLSQDSGTIPIAERIDYLHDLDQCSGQCLESIWKCLAMKKPYRLCFKQEEKISGYFLAPIIILENMFKSQSEQVWWYTHIIPACGRLIQATQ